MEEDKKQENNERDILYNTTKQISDKIQQQERSIDIENNNKDEYGFTSRKNGKDSPSLLHDFANYFQ